MSGSDRQSGAVWWYPVPGTPVTVAPGERHTWTREDFQDPCVSRSGVLFWQVGQAWSVTNGSGSMRDVYLWDVHTGRRNVPPWGTQPVWSTRTALLLPSSSGARAPHVVWLATPMPSPAPTREDPQPAGDGDITTSAGLPVGAALEAGVEALRLAVRRVGVDRVAACAAWPYFAFTTEPLTPAGPSQIALCASVSAKRAESALSSLRKALWGRAEGQDLGLLVALLVARRLITRTEVRAVTHSWARCGHAPSDLGPDGP
jgi:hypothetical protein